MSNDILAALPAGELRRIQRWLERVPLRVKQLLFDVDTPIEHVYFVEDGVASVLSVMSDGTAVEVATVGREGMVGLPLLLGTRKTASQAIMQVPGSALRMTAAHFETEIKRGGALSKLLHRYTQAVFALVAQSSGCNRVHSTEQRCARWLLLTHDRVAGDEFLLTQQFLSVMLGVRRATVTTIAGRLQKRRLIEYRRGRVRILDRARLEDTSCECYAVIRSEFDRLLRGASSSAELRSVKRVASRGGVSIVKDGGGPRSTSRPRARGRRRKRRI